MAMANDTVGDPRIDEAKEFLKLANDADTMNRQEALEDMKFVGGDQWPVELQNSRNLESRPVLTINKLDGYCRQVVNQIRQQRPRPKVHGMNSQADEKTAQVIQGIFVTLRPIPEPITLTTPLLTTLFAWVGLIS